MKIRSELWISFVLRAGISLSLLLILSGLAVTFAHHPQYLSSEKELSRLVVPGAAFPRTLPEVTAGLRSLRGQAITTSGLLLLILTPVLRVAISIAAFLEERDLRYVAITTVVLVLLILSFMMGGVE